MYSFQENFLENSNDINLPDWGPYSKKYIGISHISDKQKGLRFDLSIAPSLYRRTCHLPNVRMESNYHPWSADPDFEFYKHRHELVWKDKLYCDISFNKKNKNVRYIQIEIVNNNEQSNNLAFHFLSNLNYPVQFPLVEIVLHQSEVSINPLHYDSISFQEDKYDRHLQPDGRLLGEAMVEKSQTGYVLCVDKAEVVWNYPIKRKIRSRCFIRYKCNKSTQFKIPGCNVQFTLPPSKEWSIQEVEFKLTYDKFSWEIESSGNFYLDGIFFSDRTVTNYRTNVKLQRPYPETTFLDNRSMLIKYPDVEQYYGIVWPADITWQKRTYYTDDLDSIFRETAHEHVKTDFFDEIPSFNFYTDIFLQPIPIKANSSKILQAMVCSGKKEEIYYYMRSFLKGNFADKSEKLLKKTFKFGKQFDFSQEKMASTILTNVVYPIRTKGKYIKHYTPGRWWDSVYTWDSGCIGLGLMELSIDRAIENLNAYVTELDDDQATFIHHGSPVPTQFFVFLEIWNRTQDLEFLKYFYPRLKRCHDFLMGRKASNCKHVSSIRNLSSGLLRTWDYFYNSGGWDDYPAQKAVHSNLLQDTVTPVINSAFAIRCAKILIYAGIHLNRSKHEISQLHFDIESLEDSLNKYCWDKKSGYYGYLNHRNQDYEIYRNDKKENYNMGLDGLTPLIAGICESGQQEQMIKNMFSKNHLWSSCGLSTVDQSASYYKKDGYWNGSAWIPYQWFFFKALLDIGKLKEARKISNTLLNLWSNEVDSSYNCYEHFIIESKRGAGWHHFSGLSSPILSFYSTYYRPGRITCGFNGWISHAEFNEKFTELFTIIEFFPSQNAPAVIVTMNEKYKYNVKVDNLQHSFTSPEPGQIEILLDQGCIFTSISISVLK